jgi:PAS domain S-box-containing protein
MPGLIQLLFSKLRWAATSSVARIAIISGCILAIVSVGVWQSLALADRSELKALDGQLRSQLDTFSAHVQSKLESLELAPNVLAQSKEITTLLDAQNDLAVAAANAFLERFTAAVHASDSYILDTTGVTLAASNSQTDHSFVGQNYAFRPYFIDARSGGTGRFVAVGVTSRTLGYYVAVPIWRDRIVQGVAIVKYAINDLLRAWHRPDDIVLIADPNGIVFASNRPDFQFRSLGALSDESKEAVRASKQYPHLTAFEALPPLPPATGADVPLIKLLARVGAAEAAAPKVRDQSSDFIAEQQQLSSPNWKIVALTRATVDRRGSLTILGLGVLTAAVLVLCLVHFEHRQRGRRALAANSDRLKRSQAHLAHAQKLAGIGSWELDLASGTITWSDEHYQIAGVSRHEFTPHLSRVIALYHRDDQAQVARHFDAAEYGVTPDGIRARMVRPDGEVRHVQCECQPVFENGTLVGVLGTTQDVTAAVEVEGMLHRAKERAEAAEARLLDALETMSEGFVLFDANDQLVLCNRVYKEIYAESADFIVQGARFEEILRGGLLRGQYLEAIGREDEWLNERMAQRRLSFHAMEQALSNGRWVRIVERSTGDGGRLGVRIDITQLKRRESELQKAKEEAEQASRAKSQILATVSHELRTPLNAIIGFSEVIRDAIVGPVSDRYRDYARDIHGSGQHLLNLINDVLDQAKIETGHFELHEEEIEVAGLVANCLPIVDQRAKKGGIELAASLVPDLPLIRADRLRLKQIVLNLLSNAVKFTPSGGKVTVSTARASNGGVTIRVADTGIGMRAEDIPMALEPFRQVEGSLSRVYEGTGLGLPLAKQLIELHGGTLTIESRLGRGTTVCVGVPPNRVIHAAA